VQARVKALETALQNAERGRIVAELGLKADAAAFITATDPAAMRTQAEQLKALGAGVAAAAASDAPAAPAAPPAAGPAGTITQPPATPGAKTLDEKIADAEKAGNRHDSLTLKLQKLRGE